MLKSHMLSIVLSKGTKKYSALKNSYSWDKLLVIKGYAGGEIILDDITLSKPNPDFVQHCMSTVSTARYIVISKRKNEPGHFQERLGK